MRSTGAAAFATAMWLMITSAAYAAPQSTVAQQLPTPTPFRFLTPTPIVPRTTTGVTTTRTTTTTAPRAGGLPMELAIPALAGGLAAIGAGSALLRRKTAG